MESITVRSLEETFSELFNTNFKGLPKKITTLFDIAEFPERERVISNFYAYYFNPDAEHGFKAEGNKHRIIKILCFL